MLLINFIKYTKEKQTQNLKPLVVKITRANQGHGNFKV